MSRDANGDYSLAAGNPVVTDTVITVDWANPTMDDIKLALTDSLSRSGSGGMLAPLKADSGSFTAPGITFNSDTGSGLSLPVVGEAVMSANALSITQWKAGKMAVNDGTNETPEWKPVLFNGYTDDILVANIGVGDITTGDLTVSGGSDFQNILVFGDGVYYEKNLFRSVGNALGVMAYADASSGYLVARGDILDTTPTNDLTISAVGLTLSSTTANWLTGSDFTLGIGGIGNFQATGGANINTSGAATGSPVTIGSTGSVVTVGGAAFNMLATDVSVGSATIDFVSSGTLDLASSAGIVSIDTTTGNINIEARGLGVGEGITNLKGEKQVRVTSKSLVVDTRDGEYTGGSCVMTLDNTFDIEANNHINLATASKWVSFLDTTQTTNRLAIDQSTAFGSSFIYADDPTGDAPLGTVRKPLSINAALLNIDVNEDDADGNGFKVSLPEYADEATGLTTLSGQTGRFFRVTGDNKVYVV